MNHINVVESLSTILLYNVDLTPPLHKRSQAWLAVSARDGNADTQRPMDIGETIGWKTHATEASATSM